KHRRRTSKQQFKILEAAFEENPKPSAPKRQALANDLGMTPRGVQIWFQNRRAKAKQ
ncbi:homeobox domain-containing protein, partial [Phascolomyces articulosus]